MSVLIIGLTIVLVLLLGVLHQLLSVALPRAVRLREAPGKLLHPLLEPMFDAAHAELSALGFALDSHLALELEPASLLHAGVMRLYRSADGLTLAQVGTTLDLEDAAVCQVFLVSQSADHHRFYTTPWAFFARVFNDEDLATSQSAVSADFDAQYAAHRQWLAGKALVAWPDAASCVAELEDYENAWLQGMVRRGYLVPWRERLHFTLKGALKLLPHIFRRPPAAIADADAVPPERLALLWEVRKKRQAFAQARPVAQWGLFAFSALLFVALGSWYWSAATAGLLFAAIVLHEAGHWLAMRLLGYQRVHMLMLPLIGGVTIGEEQAASARDRAWVALAGPLPGVALAALIMVLEPGSALLWQFALMLVFINLFNLLPVLPLDGGQILQALIGRKAVWLSQIFCALSMAAIALFVWWSGLTELFILILMPFFALRQLWRQGRWQQAWRREATPQTLLEERLLALRMVADPMQPKAVTRVMQAEQLLRGVNLRAMRGGEGLLVLLLWLGCFLILLLPPMRMWLSVFFG